MLLEVMSIMANVPTNGKRLSRDGVFNILSGLLIPEYASIEGVQRCMKERLRQSPKFPKYRGQWEELARVSRLDLKTELVPVLKGEKPINSRFLESISWPLETPVNTLYPFNPDLSDEKYLEAYRQIYSSEPEVNILEMSVESAARMTLEVIFDSIALPLERAS